MTKSGNGLKGSLLRKSQLIYQKR